MALPQVTFSSDNISDVTVVLDTTPVSITSGYGGWEVVSRPRKVGLTQWNGKDPMRVSLAVLFDGYKDGKGQEVEISRLSRMALPPRADTEPPIVTVRGAAVPKPGPVKWVIESLTWGSNVIWESIGGVMVRTRQDVIVVLLEYVGDDRDAFKSLQGLPLTTTKGKTIPKRVTIKAGQTLKQVAQAVYGDSSKWQKIATANNIRDPKSVKAGTSLRIPP